MNLTDREWLTLKEAERTSGISVPVLRRACNSRHPNYTPLPCERDARGTIRIHRDELNQWIRDRLAKVEL